MYANSKIYRIVSPSNPTLVYYGSTTKPLSKRFTTHRRKEHCTSAEIMMNDDVVIELVEDFPCDNKEELLYRERWWIENNLCVNKNLPICSSDELREKHKNRVREWKRLHRNELIEQQHEYHEANRDMINEKAKNYYQANKETIAIRRRELRLLKKQQV